LCESGGFIPCYLRSNSSKSAATLSEVYKVAKEPIGSGTYGEVLAGTHRKTGARRAVKSVDKATFAKFSQTKRDFLWRELEILKHMDHPNILRMYEAFEDDRFIYLVLEFCSGGDLLERVAAPVTRMSESEAAMLFSQMLAAVQHLHVRNIMHRDLKPENFLFTYREPDREPLPPKVAPLKLIDFGLSRRLDDGATGRMTPRIGTKEYMSPEAADGTATATAADRSDMWSMGVILHTMLTGHFPNKNLQKQAPDEYFSAAFWSKFTQPAIDFLRCLLHFKPAKRLSSTDAMKHPWLLMSSNAELYSTALNIPDAIRTYANLEGFKRLVLVAAAREIDDREVAAVRSTFLKLQNDCEGSLCPEALKDIERVDGILGEIAAELQHAFSVVDADGSGTIDWTELVAACLCSGTMVVRSNPDDDSNYEGASSAAGSEALDMDPLCFRAFDLLSNGSGGLVCSGAGVDSIVDGSVSSRRWHLL
jgi:calcium-dependent protein kinase